MVGLSSHQTNYLSMQAEGTSANEVKSGPNIKSGVLNLTNYVIGIGVISLPYATAKAGLVLGLLLLIFVAIAVKYSFNMLLWSTDICGEIGYEEVAREAGGKNLANFVKVFIILDSLGVLSAYLVGTRDTLNHFLGDQDTFWQSGDFFLILMILLVVVPLSFIEKIEKLEITSEVAILPIPYLMILMLATLASVSDSLVAFNTDIFLALPIIVFSFECQQVMPPVYREFIAAGGTREDMNGVVNIVLTVVCFAYMFVSVLGYANFGDDITENVLFSFESTIWVDILWVAFAIHLLCSFPIVMYPARISCDRLFFPDMP